MSARSPMILPIIAVIKKIAIETPAMALNEGNNAVMGALTYIEAF